ncbi:MAG: hypothetical protein N3G48_05710 [Sulfolobales archaeon]|nr:hypothetical protein [Sulfolobales archaeon]
MSRLKIHIHPLVGIIAIAWVMFALYVNHIVSALILSSILFTYLILTLPSEQIRRLAVLYLWITIPPYVLLAIIYGPIEAVELILRLISITITFTSALQLIKPIELSYVTSKLGLPQLTALAIPMVIKLSDYMGYSISETVVAMRGRGLKGRKLLLNIPIPLVVHVINSSAHFAEALAQKRFDKVSTAYGKPKVGFTDAVVICYIILNAVFLVMKWI